MQWLVQHSQPTNPIYCNIISSSLQKRPKTMITWKQAEKMPAKMLQPQVVATKEVVYAGGGVTKTRHHFLDVFAYNIASGTWSTLPQAKVILFGLCHFQGSLLTIGGGNDSGITGQVFKLYEHQQEWKEVLAPMPTARFSLSVFSTDTAIAACGGGVWKVGNENPHPCTTVEVFNSQTRAWSVARDLPRLCAAMSTSMVGNLCYMLGDVDNKQRTGPLYADLTKILKPASSTPAAKPDQPNTDEEDPPTSDWHDIPVPPVDNAAIVATHTYILAIGGYQNNKTCSTVHIYMDGQKKWWKCAGGDLPHPLESSGVTILPSGEVMVVGGESRQEVFVDSVFIGKLP